MRRSIALLGAIVLAGCGGSDSVSLPRGSEPANLDAADFVDRIDNPYWPMAPGTKWVYRENGARVEVTVTDQEKEILGIQATVVRDVVRRPDGSLAEASWSRTHTTGTRRTRTGTSGTSARRPRSTRTGR